jgi:hypothetical protein
MTISDLTLDFGHCTIETLYTLLKTRDDELFEQFQFMQYDL